MVLIAIQTEIDRFLLILVHPTGLVVFVVIPPIQA